MLKKILKWILIVFVGLLALGLIIDATKSPEEKAADAAAREAQKAESEQERLEAKAAEQAAKAEKARAELASLPSYTSRDLARAYDANTVAADQTFKGKKFKVTGIVRDINTDFMGNPYVTLRGGVNEFMEPQFSFDKDYANQLANLRQGMEVTLVCVGKGDIAKTPMSEDCILL